MRMNRKRERVEYKWDKDSHEVIGLSVNGNFLPLFQLGEDVRNAKREVVKKLSEF